MNLNVQKEGYSYDLQFKESNFFWHSKVTLQEEYTEDNRCYKPQISVLSELLLTALDAQTYINKKTNKTLQFRYSTQQNFRVLK